MDFEKLAKARYSLRKFSQRPVEPEKLALILEAGRCAPTAKNAQPQRIFVANTKETLEKAGHCTPCHFHPSVAMIVGYDASVSAKHADGALDFGVMDATIAATQMMLQATDVGVGSIMIGYFDPEKIEEEFPETKGVTVVCMLFFGYEADDAAPSHLHGERKPIDELVTYLG